MEGNALEHNNNKNIRATFTMTYMAIFNNRISYSSIMPE